MKKQDRTLQSVIQKLNEFWANQNCIIWQPYNVQLGAGTGNPATLLRVLGPEPWRVGYLEPSVRPDDGRYGENPNRMQQFYQYQVILKPDPGNPQELYLKSLEAIGINPREHDIRFVEDNWKSPALGAWGLGWEVWLDGQEITQFTYFQQAGGINLDPVSVEITYGLERIVLALQGVDAAWDIDFTQGISYGDIFLQSEIEHCRYYFELAGVDGLKQVYETYEGEYKRALEAGAVIPAYDYVLKCSHLFNILDTRGAIGVTERAYYFRKMRDMTRSIAKAYVNQREELEHPFMRYSEVWGMAEQLEATVVVKPDSPTEPADVLLEIGVEELPAQDVDSAIAQLTELVPQMFDDLRLSYEAIEIFGTPRRIGFIATNVAPTQPTEVREVSGPPADRAFDADGNPTKAAIGFAKKQGIAVEDLQQKEIKGGVYVVAEVTNEGLPAPTVLVDTLPELIGRLKFAENMRWNDSGVSFSRPIRWIAALYDDRNLRFEYANVLSMNRSRGTRPMGSPEFNIKHVASYRKAMQKLGIILNREERRQEIMKQINKLASEVNGIIPADKGLLDEVTNLVEQPTALRGKFDKEFLDLPREVLVTVMRKHQRYFAVENKDGQLLPFFIAVRNGDGEHLPKVVHGNEHVLIARFTDGAFFYKGDIQKPLESYLPRLGTLTFQEKLGSMLDKNNRVQSMVEPFAELLEIDRTVTQIAQRAAHLAKADLATQMVVEMTSLQGVMGRIYAKQSGEKPDVAAAIFEHWLPRSSDDILPQSSAGILLALLDRLDSLVGLFAAGLAPTGSADPFAMRRAALGIIQILLEHNIQISLNEAIDLVAQHQPIEVTPEHKVAVLDFIIGRFQVVLGDEGHTYEIIWAILNEQGQNPVRAVQGIAELEKWVKHEDWEYLLDTYARCKRMVRELDHLELHADEFTEEVEHDLFKVYYKLSHRLHPGEHNVDRFMATFTNLAPHITSFFDDILIMDEDLKVRENRLALIQHIADMAHHYADFTQMPGF